MIAATSIAGTALLYASDIKLLGMQGIAATLSYANIYFWQMAGDYWGPQAAESPLLHTWSLSVEEQFYLFIPILLFWLSRSKRKWLISTLAAMTLVSFVLFVYASKNHPVAAFYLLPTRAWELGSGCLLAVFAQTNYFKEWQRIKSHLHSIFANIGLLTVVLSFFLISGDGALTALLAIPVVGVVTLIGFSNAGGSIAYRALSSGPVVYIGKLSYSIYLWHWPIIVFYEGYFIRGIVFVEYIIIIFSIFLVSACSYYLVEVPIRRNAKSLRPILVSVPLIVMLSFGVYSYDSSENISMYSETVWKGDVYNIAASRNLPEHAKLRMDGITMSGTDFPKSDAFATGGKIKKYGADSPELVVLGDSHALMWSGVLDEIAEENNITTSFYIANGTPTFFSIPVVATKRTAFFDIEEKLLYDQKRHHYLKKWRPKVVVISASWDQLKSAKEAKDLIDFLGGIGARVLLIEQPPKLFYGDKNAPKYLSHLRVWPNEKFDGYIPRYFDENYENGRALIRQIKGDCSHCEILPVADLFMRDGDVRALDGRDVLYIDDDHLSQQGALKARTRIKQALERHF